MGVFLLGSHARPLGGGALKGSLGGGVPRGPATLTAGYDKRPFFVTLFIALMSMAPTGKCSAFKMVCNNTMRF